MRVRTILIACLAAALLAAAGVTGWWYFMVARSEAAIGEWMQRLEDGGYSVTHGGLSRGGFPTKVQLTFRDATVGWRRGGQTGQFHVPVFAAEAPIWGPETVQFEARTGLSAVMAADGETLELSAASLQGTVAPAEAGESGRAWAAQAELGSVRAGKPGAAAPLLTAETAVVEFEVPEVLLFSPDAGGAVEVNARLNEVALQSESPLGDRIATVVLSSEVTAPLPGAWSAPALMAWRERGGRVTLHQSGVHWGPLQVQGAGELGLDPALRPEGTLEVYARGYEAAIDAFVRAGMLPSDRGSAIKLALAFISRQPDPNGPREAGAELALEDGWVKIGPFRLAPLPPVVPQ